jgi:hypothetical protein
VNAGSALLAEVNGSIMEEKLSETKVAGITSLEFMIIHAMVKKTADPLRVARACAAKAKKFAPFALHVAESSLMRLAPTEETRIGIISLSTLVSNAGEDMDSTNSEMGPSFAANLDR